MYIMKGCMIEEVLSGIAKFMLCGRAFKDMQAGQPP
jgi:hypothetical protein